VAISPSTRTFFFVERPIGKVSMTFIFKYLYTLLILKIISFSLLHSGEYGSSYSTVGLRRNGFGF